MNLLPEPELYQPTQNDQELITNLRSIVNKELKYIDLCRALNIEPKSGKQKPAQLSRLESYCELSYSPLTKRYTVTEVYLDEILQYVNYLNAPKQQLLFNIALYKQILSNGEKVLFTSNTQLLSILGEVNENFPYTFRPEDLMEINEDYLYMASMSKTVYNILMQWTKRRIDNMGFAVICTPAFRLYQEIYTSTGVITKYENIGFGTPLYSRCQKVMDRAVSEVIHDSRYLILDEKTGLRKGLKWMPEGLWYKLEATINYLAKEEFKQEGFCKMKLIKAFSAAPSDVIKQKMAIACEKVKELDDINIEAQRKIMATKQLDRIDDKKREEYIEVNVKQKPKVLFKEELKKARNKKKEG